MKSREEFVNLLGTAVVTVFAVAVMLVMLMSVYWAGRNLFEIW